MSATTNDNNNNDKNRPPSERKMKALDIVSSRSLGSLASVQETFAKGRKQRLTGRVIFAVFVGAIAGILFGFDQNIFNMIISEPDFRESMGMPQAVNACETEGAKEPAWVATQLGFIMSLYPLGCAFAAPFAGAINDRFGRYKTLWTGMFIFFVGATLQTAANGYEMLMVGRLIAGASIGVLSSVVPVYIAELAPHHLRGGLGTMFQLGITFGALFSSIWCYIMQAAVHVDYTWRLEAGFQLIIGLAMALCMCFIPESPRWLVKAGQKDKARTVLSKLRSEGEEEVTDAEFREIESEVELEKTYTAGVKDLFTKEVRLATMVALMIPIMQQFTGVNVLMGYSASIFDGMCMNGNLFTVCNNIVNFLTTWSAIYFTDKVGRKKSLIGTSLFIFLIWITGCSVMWSMDVNNSVPGGIAIATLTSIFTATFATAWGPNGWIIPNEVLPLRLRGKGSGFATFNNFFFNFVVSFTSPIAINSSMGFAGNMMLYACLMLVSAPILYFMMPETKGVPLEEMEAKFNKPLKEYIKANATDLRKRKVADHPEGEAKI